MKDLITIIELALVLLLSRPEPTHAQLAPAVFVLCIGAAAVGGVTYIYNCVNKPRWWVVKQKDNPRAIEYVITANNREEIEEEFNLVYVNGPWKNPDQAAEHCNRAGFTSTYAYVEQSLDLKTWTQIAEVECDPEVFIFATPQTTNAAAFYRVRL